MASRHAVRIRRFSLLTLSAVAIALIGPMAGTASANHGNRVLDVVPDIAERGILAQHTLTAKLCTSAALPGTSDPDNPDSENCTLSPADFDSGAINIDFEFEDLDPVTEDHSVNDPDAGTSYNTPDMTCSIAAGLSSCDAVYTGNESGTDQIRAWIDHDGTNASFANELDTTEQRDERGVPGNQPVGNPLSPSCAKVGTLEEDCTDVVEVTWNAGAPAAIDCDDANGPDTEHELNPGGGGAASNETYTCRAFDAAGNPTGDADPNTNGDQAIVIDGENESGINDPDSTDGASYDSPDYSCTIASSGSNFGRCTETVTQGELETGTADVCWWLDGEDGATLCASEPTNENTSGDGSDTANDLVDQTEKTWEDRSASEGDGGLDAEPESDTNNTGDQHTITGTVYDQFGEPFQGSTTIKFEFFTGSPSDTDNNTPGSPDKSCTTNNSPSCSVTYTSNTPGRDLVCAWINNTPSMSGNAVASPGDNPGTCNGGNGNEGLNDGDDTAGSADAPEPRDDDVDVVSKTWVNATPAEELDCQPETAQTNRGQTHTITCTASENGNPVSGTNVDVEATQVNDPDNSNTKSSPDFTCTTGNAGTCQVSHTVGTGGSTGTTKYTGWIDEDYFNGTVESDNAEGRNEASDPGTSAEPDKTDVVQNRWVAASSRRITIHSSDSSRPRGRTVRIFGRIIAQDDDCESAQTVRLRARRPGGSFSNLASTITDGAGRYSFRVRVTRTKDYRTVAPKNAGCAKAKSRIIRVRAT